MADRVTIIVTGKKELASGTSSSGRDWTLYLLTATDPSGSPLNLDGKLKSFDDLPEGQAISVEIERSESAQYGVEYMARGGGGGGGGNLSRQVDDLRDRVDTLEARHNWLLGALRASGVDLDAHVPTAPAVPAAPAPAPAPPAAPAPPDDDIPF